MDLYQKYHQLHANDPQLDDESNHNATTNSGARPVRITE